MFTSRPKLRFTGLALGVLLIITVVLVSLPFAGVAALAIRVLALAAVPVFLLAILVSPRVRAWLDEEPASVTPTSRGLVVPSRVMLYPRHSWARADGFARLSVGVDDLMQKVVGPIREVVLPEVGSEIAQGEPLFEIRGEGRRVAVKAPVSGTVVRTNGELDGIPGLVNTSPYDLGWTVVLKPRSMGRERTGLLRFEAAREWFQAETDRLLGLLTPSLLPAPALPDGGTLVADVHREVSDEAFEQIKAEMF